MTSTTSCRGYFYPRPPRGGRLTPFPRQPRNSLFLSTPSARRATCSPIYRTFQQFYFYPRPPRGGRRTGNIDTILVNVFLSTPSARRATAEEARQKAEAEFLSTPSARRATVLARVAHCFAWLFLSTPSARRATLSPRPMSWPWRYFYPRPPRGGRRHAHPPRSGSDQFLSTPSARRATGRTGQCCSCGPYFYPRPPRGGRRLPSGQKYFYLSISIHALREEGDQRTMAPAAILR